MNRKPVKLIAGTVLVMGLVISSSSISTAEETKKSYLIGFEAQEEVETFTNMIDSEIGALSDEDIEITYEFKDIPVVSAEMSEEEYQALQEDPSISYIEEDIEVTTMAQTIPWGISQISAPEAQIAGFTGEGVNVAVLDTGIEDHPDLNVQGGVSFVSGEPDYQDGNGHGTHVAGTIAALDNDEGVVGVAPNADLYAVKVLGATGSGSVSAIAQGLEWAGENGMDIANLSLGSSAPSATLEQAVDEATANGVLVVAASGNSGTSSIGYPARYDNAMAVGATDQSDSLANFSQYGEGLDIVAPGVGIDSTYPGSSYDSLSGTSMATPHVAGAAALVKEKNPLWSNEQIRAHLNETATDFGDTYRYGSGLLNAHAAVE